MEGPALAGIGPLVTGAVTGAGPDDLTIPFTPVKR